MKRISMYRSVGGKKIHVNQLAAISRKYTVKNTKKGISPVVNHKRICGDIPKDKLITNPLTGNQFVMTNPHCISGNYGVTVIGYDWIPADEYKANNGLLWEHKKYPQLENLHKKRKAWEKVLMVNYSTPEDVKFPYVYKKEYPAKKSEYPNYTLPKMNKVRYCEKLVEHKLAKWERKNPKPADMFAEEVEKWKQLRETAKERFRDFVVSVYDPLVLTGRFVVGKDNSATYQEKKVAEIKDINGEGHKVNELPKNSKLMKKVQKVTDHVKDKHPNLIACNLKDHKRQKGRIILPKAA